MSKIPPFQNVTNSEREQIVQAVLAIRPDWRGDRIASALHQAAGLLPPAQLRDVALAAAADQSALLPAIITFRARQQSEQAAALAVAEAPTMTPAQRAVGTCQTCGRSWHGCMVIARPPAADPDTHSFESSADAKARRATRAAV